jgi:hypothetical protein
MVDGRGAARLASLSFVAPADGRFRIVVTSSRDRTTGAFTLTVRESSPGTARQ